MKGFVPAKYFTSDKARRVKTEKTTLEVLSSFCYLALEANHKLWLMAGALSEPWKPVPPSLPGAGASRAPSDHTSLCQDRGEAALWGQRGLVDVPSWSALHTAKPCWHLHWSSGQGERT